VQIEAPLGPYEERKMAVDVEDAWKSVREDSPEDSVWRRCLLNLRKDVDVLLSSCKNVNNQIVVLRSRFDDDCLSRDGDHGELKQEIADLRKRLDGMYERQVSTTLVDALQSSCRNINSRIAVLQSRFNDHCISQGDADAEEERDIADERKRLNRMCVLSTLEEKQEYNNRKARVQEWIEARIKLKIVLADYISDTAKAVVEARCILAGAEDALEKVLLEEL